MFGLSNCRDSVLLVGLSVMWLGGIATSRAEEPSARLATVNGRAVSSRDVELELLVSGIKTPTPTDRAAALERIIDRTLVTHFITAKGADPLAEDVENLVQRVRKGIESGEDTVDAVLGRLHLTEDDIRKAARETVSWQAYVHRTVKEAAIRDYFESHRNQLDGTEVRIQQIVLAIPSPATPTDWTDAEKKLAELRKQIEIGKLDFAAAAKAHSQSPSAQQGGDVGFIRFEGGVPAPVAGAAFALKPGEMSQPVRSTVGVHLVQVTETKAGELSLEDARPAVLRELGDQLWETTAQSLRGKAKIVKE